MTPRRLVLGTAGITLVLAVVLASNMIATLVPVDGAVRRLGNDYFLVIALGIISLVVAVGAVGHGNGINQTRVPNPERPIAVPAPGDELSDALDSWRLSVPVVGRQRRREIHARLRESAIRVIRQTENCTADEARDRVESGAWTDDPDAAAFLSTQPTIPFSAFLRAAVNRNTVFAQRARQTAAEIASWMASSQIHSPNEDREEQNTR